MKFLDLRSPLAPPSGLGRLFRIARLLAAAVLVACGGGGGRRAGATSTARRRPPPPRSTRPARSPASAP